MPLTSGEEAKFLFLKASTGSIPREEEEKRETERDAKLDTTKEFLLSHRDLEGI